MSEFDLKAPTSKEEMDALRKMLREEIDENELDSVTGGNDNLKGKAQIPWTCHFCGATIMCRAIQDAAKHMTKCPNNPFK